ncbi:DEAD/DEAH box helicase family protein [Dehalococcoidia bacterium]|nr:DEAD/DEAH box helicase family protein [Dehalococcoidia bacterium]
MSYNESDTRAKLITPALHAAGWNEDMIRREVSAGAVEIINGVARKGAVGKVDYTLRLKFDPQTQPVAVGIIEAKAEKLPPGHGLQQAKNYAKRLNVPFVFSSNGHQFREYDTFSGLTQPDKSMPEFPSPNNLRERYEDGRGFKLDSELAKPLLTPYAKGEGRRRYYQDAAIRSVLEKIAVGKKRALLSLATGSGKTFIAVNLLKKIADAKQLKRALFICDRDELRTQASAAFQEEFGGDVAVASGNNPQKNARVVIVTYQTLGIDTDSANSSYLTTNYPDNYFSHIIIDECHRSAWGKWFEVLNRNRDAIQIGLTATPREFRYVEKSDASGEDEKILSDNIAYFGEPVYEYSLGQGIQDGFLAQMQIIRTDTFINRSADSERETRLAIADLKSAKIKDANTGEEISPDQVSKEFQASSFEDQILLPDRVHRWCSDLFDYLLASGKPEQKTIIFCVRDRHADDVAFQLNNIYSDWCTKNNQTRAEDFAFKCTAESGKEFLADIRGSTRHHFIATTVDLLSTGVDVPPVVNIVFFKYVNSPIAFYQMVGRGTRLHPQTNKLMFNVYDYTNATRLFSEELATNVGKKKGPNTGPPKDPERSLVVEGLHIKVSEAGVYILTIDENGQPVPMTLEDYKNKLSEKLVADIPNLDEFREQWIEPDQRREILRRLPDSGRAPQVIKAVTEMEDYDVYDVITEIGYGLSPKTMTERAEAFVYKNKTWLNSLNKPVSNVIMALASQFGRGGTENLENPQIWRTQEVQNAGGIPALRGLGNPQQTIKETKRRMFTA